MSNFIYVYVGKPAAQNFGIGMGAGVWGWKRLDRSDHVQNARTVLASESSDSFLVFAHRATSVEAPSHWPRTPIETMDGWADAVFDSVLLAKAVGSIYEADAAVWPDAAYPWRVDVQPLIEAKHVRAMDLPPDALTAIRRSITHRGNPVAGPAPLEFISDGPS